MRIDVKRAALWIGVPLAVTLGFQAVSAAVTLKTWNSGDTLTAADLNANFDAINAGFVGLHGDQTIAGTKTFSSPIVAPPTYAIATTTNPFSTTSTTFVTIPGLSANVTTHGNPVMITVNSNFNAQTALGGTAWAPYTITRDGMNLGHAQWGMQIAEDESGRNDPMTITFVDKPDAGPHTYAVQIRAGLANMTVETGEAGQTQQLALVELN